jgi:hypothetical protein
MAIFVPESPIIFITFNHHYNHNHHNLQMNLSDDYQNYYNTTVTQIRPIYFGIGANIREPKSSWICLLSNAHPMDNATGLHK